MNALWNLGRSYFPETTTLLEQAAYGFDKDGEDTVLQQIYLKMSSWNFSADLLARTTANLAVMEIGGVRWSDWGRPERIFDTLGRTGKALPYLRDQWFEPEQTSLTKA